MAEVLGPEPPENGFQFIGGSGIPFLSVLKGHGSHTAQKLEFVAEKIRHFVEFAMAREPNFAEGVLHRRAVAVVEHSPVRTPDAFVGRHRQAIRSDAHPVELGFGGIRVTRGHFGFGGKHRVSGRSGPAA